jgi:hypothetical protein
MLQPGSQEYVKTFKHVAKLAQNFEILSKLAYGRSQHELHHKIDK